MLLLSLSALAAEPIYVMDCGGTRAEVVARYTPGGALEAMHRDTRDELRALGPQLAEAFGVGEPSVRTVWLDDGGPPYKLVVGKCRGGVYATTALERIETRAVRTDVHTDLVRIAANELDVRELYTAWVNELEPGLRQVDLWYTPNAKAWGLYDGLGRSLVTHSPPVDGLYVSGMEWFSFEAEGGRHLLGVGEASQRGTSGIHVVVVGPDGRAQSVYTLLSAGDGC